MTKIRLSRQHNIIKVSMDEVMIIIPPGGSPDRLADRYAKQALYGLRQKLKEAIQEQRKGLSQ